MFLLLVLLVFPGQLLGILPVALLITFVLIVVARPLAAVCLKPIRQLTRHHSFTL